MKWEGEREMQWFHYAGFALVGILFIAMTTLIVELSREACQLEMATTKLWKK